VSKSTLPLSKKLVFSGVAVVGVLLLLELLARLIVTTVPNPAWEAHRRGITTRGFAALERILVPDPHLFWKLRPGLENESLYGQMEPFPPMRFKVSTDDRGLRRMPQVADARRTVLFLGDSCTFGLGVDDDETFPAQVQQQLQGVQVINAGVPGYTAFQGNRMLELLLPDKPDVAVITFGFNGDLQWDNRSDLEHAASIGSEKFNLLDQLRMVDLLRQVLPRHNAPEPANARPRLTDAEFDGQIRTMIDACRGNGITPVLVAWPMVAQAVEGGASLKQQVLRRVAAETGVRLLEPVHAFRSGGGAKLYRDAVHANAAGCRTAAAAMLPAIRSALEE